MGVASFVYLRRILEDIINKKYIKLFPKDTQDIRFMGKLQAVETKEEIIPHEFDELRTKIYAILSKGVHEYQRGRVLGAIPERKVNYGRDP